MCHLIFILICTDFQRRESLKIIKISFKEDFCEITRSFHLENMSEASRPEQDKNSLAITKSLYEDERFGPILRSIHDRNQHTINQMQDPSILFKSKGRFYNPIEFTKYPESPTAQKYLVAFQSFFYGFECLHTYTSSRDKVENDADCSTLEVGFRAYAAGYILENVMISQFPPPANVMDLLDQYLKLRPLDAFAEYFKLRLFIREKSTQEKLMKNIVACEVLTAKLELRDPTDEIKMILTEVYGVVAALYTVTDQHARAIDCFENAVKIDETNTNAIYGVAYNIRLTESDRAETLFLEFLRKAPKCDKQYPRVLYHLSLLYLHSKKTFSKAVRYFEMAQASEMERLPFLPEVDIDAKTLLVNVMSSNERKYCNYPECEKDPDSDLELKQCTRCKKVWYCGRDCQRRDWAYHKKLCREFH